jgi:hypothetical protein
VAGPGAPLHAPAQHRVVVHDLPDLERRAPDRPRPLIAMLAMAPPLFQFPGALSPGPMVMPDACSFLAAGPGTGGGFQLPPGSAAGRRRFLASVTWAGR